MTGVTRAWHHNGTRCNKQGDQVAQAGRPAVTSRAELEEKLGRGFSFVFANSQLIIDDVSVEFLKPDVAVAFVRWTLTGALSPTGAPSDVPQQGIQTQVLVRHAGEWNISHFQNTNSVPERPFPLPSNFRFVPAPEE